MEWANINFPNTLRWDITQARNISVSISRERTGRGLQPGKPRVRVTFGNCGHYWPRWRLHFLRNSTIIEKGSFVVESPYLLWNWFENFLKFYFLEIIELSVTGDKGGQEQENNIFRLSYRNWADVSESCHSLYKRIENNEKCLQHNHCFFFHRPSPLRRGHCFTCCCQQ